jgi:hypothetical protein
MVGRVHDEAAHHLVSPGYLILDDQAAWREGGVIIRRISRRLLPDTLARALDASRRVASFAIITDAKDEDARSFYQHYGFQLLPTESHDRHLFLPMGTVERLFAG